MDAYAFSPMKKSKRLDAVREVVTSLGDSLGHIERATKLLHDPLARHRRLEEEAKDAHHRESAILDLLQLLLGVLLLRIVESKRVPTSLTLAEAEVPCLLISTDDAVDAEKLNGSDGGRNLPQARRRDRGQGAQGVHVREGIHAHILITGQVVDIGENPPEGGKHGHAAVDDLCLSVPLEGTARAADQPGAGGVVGETHRVKANITGEAAVQVRGALVERQGDGEVVVSSHAHRAGGTAGQGRGGNEGARDRGQGQEGNHLHPCVLR